MELIIEETTRYSIHNGSSFKIDTAELEKYIGLLILMNIVRMHRYRCYWQSDFNYEPISNMFTRRRFELVSKFIHFNYNNVIKRYESSNQFYRFSKYDHLRSC